MGFLDAPGSLPTNPPAQPGVQAPTQNATRSQRILRVRTAGFGRRSLAALIDVALVATATVAATAIAALALGVPLPASKELGPDFVLAGLLDRNPMAVGALGLLLGMGTLYQIYLGGILGQTAGKRLLGLRVISSHGRSPGPIMGCLRFAALALSLAPAGLGWLWCLFDREHRSLHDHLSGTYVIAEDK
jgi:resuscitation-promoting factor RpfA